MLFSQPLPAPNIRILAAMSTVRQDAGGFGPDFSSHRESCLEASFLLSFLFIYERHTVREREAETKAEGEAGSMHWEPDVGFDPGSPGSRPGTKVGATPLRHPGSQKPAFK